MSTEHVQPPHIHEMEGSRKSLSQFQKFNDKKLTESELLHKNCESSLRRQQPNIVYRFDDERRDLHVNTTRDTGTRSLSPTKKNNTMRKSITAIDAPRLYTASYYTKKAGASNMLDGDVSLSDHCSHVNKAKYMQNTPRSMRRLVSQNLSSCLLQLKSSFNDELGSHDNGDESKKKRESTNPLASFCFVDNFLDVTQDSIDITTIDIRSSDDLNSDISALHDTSPIRSTGSRQQVNVNTNRTATKSKQKVNEDYSTNHATAVTSSNSNDNVSDNLPKALRVRKIHKTPLPQHDVIKVNPDDYDFSYRNNSSDLRLDAAVFHIEPYSETPSIPAKQQQQQRDLQRRPRGTFERVTSNDEKDDCKNDLVTSCNIPYDETKGQAQNDALQLKFKQALHEIERQHKLISNLKNQLIATKLELETEKTYEEDAIDDVTADATTNINKIKIDSDDRLLREKEANKLLKDEIECLKRDVINLSLELELTVRRRGCDNSLSHPGTSAAAVHDSLGHKFSAASNKSDSDPEMVSAETPVKEASKTIAIVEEAITSLGFTPETLQASLNATADSESQVSAVRAANELHAILSDQLQLERDDANKQTAFWQKEMLQAKRKQDEMDNHICLCQAEMLQTTQLNGKIESLKKDIDFSMLRASDYATNVHQLEQELIRAQLDAAKHDVRASPLQKDLCEYMRPAVPAIIGPQLTINNKALDAKEHATSEEAEQMKELQKMEDELTQRFYPSMQHHTSTSMRDAGEDDYPNLVNRCSNNTIQRETSRDSSGSLDLIDILRMKLSS